MGEAHNSNEGLDTMFVDPYVLTPDKIKEAPTTFRGRLKFLGPSFILSASIVGSGELIATLLWELKPVLSLSGSLLSVVSLK